MTDILANIALALQQDFSDLERKRASRDLQRVCDRLRRRDYRISGFGTNSFDIPDRAQELLTELDFHASLGRAWAAVFSSLKLVQVASALDLCPGYTPKVELGLYYAGFQGHLLVLDRDGAALASLQRFLSFFGPRFVVHPIVVDLLTATLAPQPLVVGHHVMDDVILDDHCRGTGIELASLYSEESALREAWSAILARGDAAADTLSERIAAALDRLVAPGGTLLLAQYPSYTERLLGLQAASEFSCAMLDETCARLAQRDFARIDAQVQAAVAGVSEFVQPSAFRGLRRA